MTVLSFLIVPLTMTVCGFLMYRFAPKKINRFVGYRSARSMKNEDTWLFANRYCGKLWIRLGTVMLIISVIAVMILSGTDDTIRHIAEIAELVILVGSVIPVEIMLKHTFDENGKNITGGLR